MQNAKFVFKVINLSALVLGSLLWLLSVLIKDTFGWFNFAYAVTVICGIWAISFILQGAILKDRTVMRRSRVIIGVFFAVVSALSLVWAIKLPQEMILPIVCFVVSLALFAGMFIAPGKKWDVADNEKEGCKSYQEKEEEKKED